MKCVYIYLGNGELVNGTSLSIVNGDFVSWNWRRVVTGSIGDPDRRLKLRRCRYAAEFQRIEGVISSFPRGELPEKCWFAGNWSAGGTWSSNIHFGCFSLLSSVCTVVHFFLSAIYHRCFIYRLLFTRIHLIDYDLCCVTIIEVFSFIIFSKIIFL